MRRLLTTTMALGLVITAMNFTGIFAVFSDRATTGTNSAESGSQPRIADLQIATSVAGTCDEVTFVENLATGVISATDLQPNSGSGFQLLCLRNSGSATLDLSIAAIDVVDTDVACTGDEAAAGDETCGTGAAGDGELSAALIANVSRVECATQQSQLNSSGAFSALAATGVSLGSVDPAEVACIFVAVQMAIPGQLGLTDEQVQQAQSDKVEWRYAFDGAPA